MAPPRINFQEHEALPVHHWQRTTVYVQRFDSTERGISPLRLEDDELNRHVLPFALQDKPEHATQGIIGAARLIHRPQMSGERLRLRCSERNSKIDILRGSCDALRAHGKTADQRIGSEQTFFSRLVEAFNALS